MEKFDIAANEAMNGNIEELTEKALPKMQTAEEHLREKYAQDKGAAKKVSVTIPEKYLTDAKNVAHIKNISLSQWISDLLECELCKDDNQKIIKKYNRLIRNID